MNDIVKLNVGGTHFTTSRSTLMRYPDSMLATMFSPDNPMKAARKDKQGAYFIDRNPKDQVIHLNVGGTTLPVLKETLLLAGPDSILVAILGNTVFMPRDKNGVAFIDCAPEEFKIVLNLLKTKQFPFDLGPGVVEDLARRFNIGWMITMAREYGPKPVVHLQGGSATVGIIQYPEKRLTFGGNDLFEDSSLSYANIVDKGVYHKSNRLAHPEQVTPPSEFDNNSSFWYTDQRFQWSEAKKKTWSDLRKLVSRRY